MTTSTFANRYRPFLDALEDRLCLALAVPALSSLPGADHTIYLDFDGHVTTGTQWNTYFKKSTVTSPAYDIDGSPGSFNSAELTRIQNIWKRVAEDFIPFEVNVTTVDPGVEALRKSGSSDTRWGIRVVITRDTQSTGAGGIAWIGSFNWNSDTAVFVYNTSEVGVAEAASHEIGHSLYLAHDGTGSAEYYTGHGSGETGWAPIMGAGYSKNVTQWDRGEYYRSDNKGSSANSSRGADDLYVITHYNGFGYRDDDHGNSAATATQLIIDGDTLSGSGIIERTSDVDVFSFTTTGGTIVLDIESFRPGPNLDIKAELFDADGNRVALSNPASLLDASIEADLAAGTYYLHIDGVGVGNPSVSSPTGYSDYASLGRYSITGSSNGELTGPPPPTPEPVGTLSIAAASADKGEGKSGFTAFTFTVTRGDNTSGNVSVSYAVSGSGDSPASANDFRDSVLPTGRISFADGQSARTITIYVRGDKVREGDEGFTVTLANPSDNAVIDLASADGLIREDDVKAALQLAAEPVVAEGTSDTPTEFTFTVTRSGNLAGKATVKYKVVGVGTGGAATAADFAAGRFPTGKIVFENGESTKEVTFLLAADSNSEDNELFAIVLRAPSANASIVNGRVEVTIADDDDLPPSADPDHHEHAANEPDFFWREPEELRDVIPSLPAQVAKKPGAAAARQFDLAWLKQHQDEVFRDVWNWL